MKDDTIIVTAGRDPENNHGAVNPPVYHMSTIVKPTVAAMRESGEQRGRRERGLSYGRMGTPTHFAFQDALLALEGGDRCLIFPSGVAAISAVLHGVASAGDRILMVDTVYQPARRICTRTLSRYGIATDFFPPDIDPAALRDMIDERTKLVYLEAPGSETFEMLDVPALTQAAHEKDVLVAMDNTWASPYFFKPIQHGVDISIQAGTKYVVGHSDVMMGIVCMNDNALAPVFDSYEDQGHATAPDDIYLAQRGLRTLAVRMPRHFATATILARWLQARPEVEQIFYPALEDDPGHALWRRDFAGASGLFGLALKPCGQEAVEKFVDSLKLFSLGASWGGYESLVKLSKPIRTASRPRSEGPLLRFHAGLEDPDDLIEDLSQALIHLKPT